MMNFINLWRMAKKNRAYRTNRFLKIGVLEYWSIGVFPNILTIKHSNILELSISVGYFYPKWNLRSTIEVRLLYRNKIFVK